MQSIDPNELTKYREAIREVQAREQATLMRHAERAEEREKEKEADCCCISVSIGIILLWLFLLSLS